MSSLLIVLSVVYKVSSNPVSDSALFSLVLTATNHFLERKKRMAHTSPPAPTINTPAMCLIPNSTVGWLSMKSHFRLFSHHLSEKESLRFDSYACL